MCVNAIAALRVSRHGVRERVALGLGEHELLALFPALLDVHEVQEYGAQRSAGNRMGKRAGQIVSHHRLECSGEKEDAQRKKEHERVVVVYFVRITCPVFITFIP